MSFLDTVAAVNDRVGSIVGGIPMMVILLLTGLLFTVRLKGLQFRRFGYALKHTLGRAFSREKAEAGALTPFQAMCTALAATIGTGSIAGVAGAIAIGGPGAVFWMWVSALVGMATKYAEITLALRYRERGAGDEYVGGPMYSIRNGLGKRAFPLAAIFAVCGALAALGTGNMTQVNTIAACVNQAITSFTGNDDFATPVALGIGILLAAVLALVLLGGLRRIGSFTERLIPTMCVLYVCGALGVVVFNFRAVGPAFAMIFKGAFSPSAVCGGVAGMTILKTMEKGVGRGIFSNEAGLGSAPMAHATATAKTPAAQGMFGIMEVFLATILICTLTAVTILSSGVVVPYGEAAGATLTTSAFASVMGERVASLFMAIAITMFALSTALSWGLYGARCMEFLFGARSVLPYKLFYIAVTVPGAVAELGLVWAISDTFNCFMAIPNLIGLILLSGEVVRLTKQHFDAETHAEKESEET